MNFILETTQLSHFLYLSAFFFMSVSALALIASWYASKKLNQFHNYNDNAYLARLLLVYIYFYEIKFKVVMYFFAAFFAVTATFSLFAAHYSNEASSQPTNPRLSASQFKVVDFPDQKTQQKRHEELIEAIKKTAEPKSTSNNNTSMTDDSAHPIIAPLLFFILFSSLYLITKTPASNPKKILRIGALTIISAGITFSLFDRFNAIEKFSPTFIKFDYHASDKTQKTPDNTPERQTSLDAMKVSCDEHLAIGPFKTGSNSELESGKTLAQRVSEVRSRIMEMQESNKLSLIMIIGSTDNRPLRRELLATFESNAGLGQSRANEVKRMLGEVNATLLPLNVGPNYALQQHTHRDETSLSIARQLDRQVKICIFGMARP